MEHAKLMIVDDEETLATFLAKVLKEDNPDFEIEVKTSGEEALDALSEFAPDIVLLDIRLPKKDGTQVLKEIKEFDRNIQVVMMTGFASLESAIASLREGAYDYVNKPFETNQVKTIIKNALERRMLLREREILIGDLSEANEKLAEANTMLKEKRALADKALEHRVEQLSKLDKISHKINAQVNIEKLIKLIPEATVNLFGIQGSIILFLNENKSNLTIKGGAGETNIPFGTEISSDIIPFDVSVTEKSVDQVIKTKIGKKEIGPIVCSSLSSGGKNIGALCLFTEEQLDKNSLQLLNTFSSTASIALENASHFSDLQRSALEIILSLLLLKGFKDPVLKASSERISELVESLANEIGVDKEDIRNIKYAALIHDIGKIVLPEEKPDHKQVFKKTFEILGHVRFMKKALNIVKYSTEDFSKKGKDIPILSRIFSVVYNFEELAKEGKNVSDVIKFLDKEKGKKFDPEIVENFKKVLESKIEE
ncbi:response regulator [candidate division WOR-3 bacterium]|nr:response regulator [candidate division WOR-3 bacterium]